MALENDTDVFGIGMTGNIGKSFLNDAIENGLNFGRQSCLGKSFAVKIDGNVGASGPLIEQIGQSFFQSEVVESGGAKLDGDAMDFLAKVGGELLEFDQL